MAQEGTLPYKDALLKMRQRFENDEPIVKKTEESSKGFFQRPRVESEEVEEESIEDYLQNMFNVISENNLLLKKSVVVRDK